MARSGGLPMILLLIGTSAVEAQESGSGGYRSFYSVEFTVPRAELLADLERTERGDPRIESEVPHGEWYSPKVRREWGAWGPPARHYPVPAGLERHSAEWKRERAIAVALRFVGYAYQHHHVPDWSPPADWPWIEVQAGRNGKGLDCSNFTSFVYNQGFGLKLNSDVAKQAELRAGEVPSYRREVPLHHVELPSSMEERVRTLRAGDLLFIRGKPGGPITHVVLWVGPIGRSPSGVPLILDSHGQGEKDDEDRPIPAGIHLRPYREKSWYFQESSHALRVFADGRR